MVNFQPSSLMMEKLTISQVVVLSLVLLAFVALATILDWRDSHMRSGTWRGLGRKRSVPIEPNSKPTLADVGIDKKPSVRSQKVSNIVAQRYAFRKTQTEARAVK
jgi:hypothetical protein